MRSRTNVSLIHFHTAKEPGGNEVGDARTAAGAGTTQLGSISSAEELIDMLIMAGKLDADDIDNKWV